MGPNFTQTYPSGAKPQINSSTPTINRPKLYLNPIKPTKKRVQTLPNVTHTHPNGSKPYPNLSKWI